MPNPQGDIFDQLAAANSKPGVPPASSGGPMLAAFQKAAESDGARRPAPAPEGDIFDRLAAANSKPGVPPASSGDGMVAAFQKLAANPDLGTYPVPREPGSFGQFDPASEGHMFTSATNKGLHEGIALAFGLKKPQQDISSDLADVFDSLVNGAQASYQKMHDITSQADPNAVLTPALLAPLEMVAQGIEGTRNTLKQGFEEMWNARQSLQEGKRTPELDQQFGRGAGMVLSAIGQLALAGEGERAGEKFGAKTGEAMAERAPGPGNSLVKARKGDFFFSKDPGRYLVDEPVKPPIALTRLGQLEDLMRQNIEHSQRLHSQVQNLAHSADTIRAIQPGGAIRTVPNLINWADEVEAAADEAKQKIAKQEGITNRAKIASAINAVRDDILKEHDTEGNITGTKPREAVPSRINEIKKDLGGRGNYKVITDPDVAEVAAAKDWFVKNAYKRLNTLVDDAVGGNPGARIKDLNRRYANAIEFRELLKDQIDKERGSGGVNALRRKLEWGAAAGGLLSGHPWATALGMLEGLNRMARTVPARVVEAKALRAAPGALRTTGGAAGLTAPIAPAAGKDEEAARGILGDAAQRVLSGG